MKIIIAPGAFKHSLSAVDAAAAIQRGLAASGLRSQWVVTPIADGGNGTLDVFLLHGGRRVEATVRGPHGRPVKGAYALLDDVSSTAVIEMAQASGLELTTPEERQPGTGQVLRATTYGTGELLRAALDAGARRVIIGMGGSATVDGGAGALQALGVHLLDADGREVGPGGGRLNEIATIDVSGLDPRWRDVEVIIASDVDNPTLGSQGAAAVFGPQKGAGPQEVALLEANLTHFFTMVRDHTGVDVRALVGGGAAGALSAGLTALLGGTIRSGIDLILEYTGFDAHLRNANLVITGEGQIDAQTVRGKGPIGVAQRARSFGVKTVALVGGLNAEDALLHDAGMWAVLPIVTAPMPLDEALERAVELTERAAQRLGYLLQIGWE
jgi:glycerate kinase